MPSINIPFPGFYESVLSNEMDHCLEQYCEHMIEESGREYEFSEHMSLDESELAEIIIEATTYDIIHNKLAENWVESFAHVAGDYLPFKLNLSFEEMISPRYYNFETDRVFCQIPYYQVKRLAAISRKDNHKTLSKVIKDNCTSYDGFRSFYSNELRDWLEKPLVDWDHNELGLLLTACLIIGGANFKNNEFEYDIYCSMCDSDDFDRAWADGVDWAEVERNTDKLRKEKDQDFKADNPERAESQFDIKYFCRHPDQLAFQL